MDRRNFLKKSLGMLGWASFLTWVLGSAAVTARFFFPRIRYEPPTSFKVGRPEDYIVDTVDSRWLKEHGIFIVREPKGIYVLSAICTHLGCNINWFDSESQFKCPCHGSFFDLNGDVIGGPAPEPLFRTMVRLTQDGSIEVNVTQNANKPGSREKGDYLLKV